MKFPSLRKLLKPTPAAIPKTLEELLDEAQQLIDRSHDLRARDTHLAEAEDYADVRGAIAEFEAWVASHRQQSEQSGGF